MERPDPHHCLGGIGASAVPDLPYGLLRRAGGQYGNGKEASLPRVGRGILYFSDFVGPYWLFVPALGLLVGAYYPLASAFRRSSDNGRSLAALLALPMAGALNAGYIIAMGGDDVHARLLIAPFFAACVPVATVPLARKYLIALLVLPWAMVCALSLRSTDDSNWSTVPFMAVNGRGNVAPAPNLNEIGAGDAVVLRRRASTPNSGRPGIPQRLDVVRASDIHSTVIVTSWIGTEPYELGTGVQFLDLLGLADPTAHRSHPPRLAQRTREATAHAVDRRA